MAKLLQIQLKKGRDGPHTLVCTRVDGTVTMQKNRTGFLPLHDLTHYAVETVLRYRRGFFGLIAEGWDIGQFEDRSRGRIPDEGRILEHIVGLLDVERNDRTARNAVVFNRTLLSQDVHVSLSDLELNSIRACFRDLEKRWDGLLPGESLHLVFESD